MESVTYRLEQFDFEGPLDLLLALIQKNKVNITDIPISLICDQYLAYIEAAQDLNMELTGDFIGGAKVYIQGVCLLVGRTLGRKRKKIRAWICRKPCGAISRQRKPPRKWRNVTRSTAGGWSRTPMK